MGGWRVDGVMRMRWKAGQKGRVPVVTAMLHEVDGGIEIVSPEGTFCDTVQVPSNGGDMELI